MNYVPQARLFESVDMLDIHGGLLALTELAAAYYNLGQSAEDQRHKV